MNFDPNQKSMHPTDKRNLIIFILASLLLWFAFEHFVIGPRVEEVRKQQALIEKNAPDAKLAKAEIEKIRPRAEKIAATKRITLSNAEIMGTIPVVGNRIDDISLKNYFTELKGDKPVVLMSPSETEFPLYAETGWLAEQSNIKLPDKNTE